jgi:hypothetical protein
MSEKPTIAIGMIGNRELFLIADAQNYVCPRCGKIEDVIYLGDSIWPYCKTHKVKWLAGWDLSLSAQVTDEQRRRYAQIGMSEFKHIYCEEAKP